MTSPSTPGRRTDPAAYSDLRDYAVLGDGRTVALVTKGGSVDWFPVPDLDSVPPFAALLDAEDGGRIELAPTIDWSVERRYLPGTNVVESVYTTARGRVRVTDSLNSGVAGRLPWAELARRVEGLEGRVPMAWRVRAGTGLGSFSPWVQQTAHGPVLRMDEVMMAVRTHAAGEPEVGAQHLAGTFETEADSRHLLALVGTHDEPLNLPPAEHIDARIDRSIDGWREWTSQVGYEGEDREQVLRSALALKLLLHSPTGAIAAAGTTSLPESLEGGKNWDYRYTWVRDTAYTLDVMLRLGLREEPHAAVAWLLHTIHTNGLEVFYRLNGDRPGERSLADVPGWRGIQPVVTGNPAAGQLQLGIYGDLFSVVRRYVEAGHVLDRRTARLLGGLADRCCDTWQRRDAGIWELEREEHYTSSKIGCWQALDCAVALGEVGQLPGDVERWAAERDRIHAWVSEHCWSAERRAYTWFAGSDLLDASVLQAAVTGFDTGERVSQTIDALREELGRGPLLYRYSGAEDTEGAFLTCSFWMVTALVTVGRGKEGAQLLAELTPLANDVGLFAEMVDPATGDFLGNLPQGLSHLSHIDAALAVSGYDEGGTKSATS
ncbi:glycoside hydrolase family 15 protein [Kineosporia rhizophila]|uniref:glycoside hydrolase family 15 protein n=1 Tax=Kineosporia TaxID=49184 RepID=UPI001E54F591|nr:glycoside hydrolase family 15 protein [Kineosporia sp. NBRC 101677]MCE0537109.1 glycoside hydrolase family 15 protein [Kineosporia rhizophila]GLY16046.1 glycosyl hydrolase [Kineosporia sp. NBRC 101677]